MLNNKLFKYVVAKANNDTETKERHRAITLAEACSYLSGLLGDLPDNFTGELAIIYKPKDQKIIHFITTKEGLNLTMNEDLLLQLEREYLVIGQFVKRFMNMKKEKDV